MRIRFPDLTLSTDEIIAGLTVQVEREAIAGIQLRSSEKSEGHALADPITIALIQAGAPVLIALITVVAKYYFEARPTQVKSEDPAKISVMIRGPKGSMNIPVKVEKNGVVVFSPELIDLINARCGEISEISIREAK